MAIFSGILGGLITQGLASFGAGIINTILKYNLEQRAKDNDVKRDIKRFELERNKIELHYLTLPYFKLRHSLDFNMARADICISTSID